LTKKTSTLDDSRDSSHRKSSKQDGTKSNRIATINEEEDDHLYETELFYDRKKGDKKGGSDSVEKGKMFKRKKARNNEEEKQVPKPVES
jgi:hypothetical protein